MLLRRQKKLFFRGGGRSSLGQAAWWYLIGEHLSDFGSGHTPATPSSRQIQECCQQR